MQPETFELPAVRVAPLTELAAAARNCTTLTSARRLAEWTGRRRITKAGHLNLADARKAVQELRLPGDQGPGRTPARNATQFPELHQLWQLAVETGLLSTAGGEAMPGPALGSLTRNRDDDVVSVWTELLSVSLEQFLMSPEMGNRLVALAAQLYVDSEPASIEDLLYVAMAGMTDVDPDEIRADPSMSQLAQGFAVPVSGVLGVLVDIDAATLDDDQVALTDLGRFGLGRWFANWGIRAPTVTDLAAASAGEMLDLCYGLDGPEQLEALFNDWVSARGAEDAAAALVEYARGGAPSYRVMAFNLLNDIGAPAEAAVRSVLDEKDLRPHAMAWLAVMEIAEIEPVPDDLRRLFIEMIAVGLGDEDELRETIAALDPDPDQAELIGELWQCDHADTAAVLDALASYHPVPAAAKAARKALMRLRSSSMKTVSKPSKSGKSKGPSTYQLKITLQDTKPPIWRRIQVPGSIKLPQLHDVIQTAMGWSDSHLHEFEIDGVRYGQPSPYGGDSAVSEAKVKLVDVAAEGDRMEHTYDFGDGWCHELLVEKVLPVQKGAANPKIGCLDGELACPLEDIGGPWGHAEFLEAYGDPKHQDHQHYREWAGDDFDAEAFDADRVTAHLRRLRLR